jgi:hypothetical protein
VKTPSDQSVEQARHDDLYEVLPPPPREPVEKWRPPPEFEPSRECGNCGYDMRAIPSERCPECGEKYTPPIDRPPSPHGKWEWIMPMRWIVIGVVPMFGWSIAAWVLLWLGGPYGFTIAFAGGVVLGLGMAMWCALQAYDEEEEIEGMVAGFAVLITVAFINCSALYVLMSIWS